MKKVTIIDDAGSRSTAYIDESGSDEHQKKQQFKERLHLIYLVVAITAFSIAIYSQLRPKKI